MFRIIIIFLTLLLSNNVLGETNSITIPNTDLVIGLSAGSTWLSGNNAQTIHLQPNVIKTYTADHINAIPSFEFFVGAQRPMVVTLLKYSFMSQLGLSVAEANNAELTGNIWEDANPNFNNFDYKYKINHTSLSIKGRLICNEDYFIKPYVSGSMGVGFNRAFSFTITPKIFNEVPSPLFTSNTSTTFSYSLGIGLQKSFEKLQVGLGYEFADWGKSNLSSAQGQTTNSEMTINHLYAQTLQLSLFYA